MQYTFALSRRSLPVRCLCLLLIVLVLWCSFMMPHAGAVALEAAATAYSAALVGAILVGAGVVFASHGDMQAVGAAMVKSWQQSNAAIGSKISALASWAVQHGEAAAKGALRVGKELYQAVVDAFNASYSDGKVSLGSDVVTLPTDATDEEVSAFLSPFTNKDVTSFYFSEYTGASNERVHHVYCGRNGSVYTMYLTNQYGNGELGEYSIDINGETLTNYYCTMEYDNHDHWIYLRFYVLTRKNIYYKTYVSHRSWHLSLSASPISVPVPQPDLKYPSDDYLVRMPDLPAVDGVTGSVTWPSDAAYTKDAVAVPYPTDADGVKVPDIPYDKVVDKSTGKTLDDTDTGTDTDKPGTDTDKPGTETGGKLGEIIALLKNFFDSPSDFKLDMDGFRNLAIKDKFPFCIPFDMVDSVKQFAANAADYEFRIDLQTQYFSVDHVVDLKPLAVPLAFFRYIVVTWFVWVLLSRTRDLMKW